MKRKILVVPQLLRNYEVIKHYFTDLTDVYDIIILRNTFFGKVLDVGNLKPPPGCQLDAPPFLNPVSPPGRELTEMFEMRRLDRSFVQYLQDRDVALVIVGVDSTSIGRWTASVANRIGLPTLVCQEGTRWLYEPFKLPLRLLIKRTLKNLLASVIYPPAKTEYSKEYCVARNAAVWGDFDRRMALNSGAQKTKFYIVGDPRLKMMRFENANRSQLKRKIIFLDAGILSLPKGIAKISVLDEFRDAVFTHASKDLHIGYKMHPFTRQEERYKIVSRIRQYKYVEHIENGAAEDWMAEYDACITYPSASVYSILAKAIPLLLVNLSGAGYGNLIWDPIAQYKAGIKLSSPKDIAASIMAVYSPEWRAEYVLHCKRAAEDVVGPLDDNASKRFKAVVESILSKNN